jgi:hypothetical protein
VSIAKAAIRVAHKQLYVKYAMQGSSAAMVQRFVTHAQVGSTAVLAAAAAPGVW